MLKSTNDKFLVYLLSFSLISSAPTLPLAHSIPAHSPITFTFLLHHFLFLVPIIYLLHLLIISKIFFRDFKVYLLSDTFLITVFKGRTLSLLAPLVIFVFFSYLIFLFRNFYSHNKWYIFNFFFSYSLSLVKSTTYEKKYIYLF